MLLERGFDRGSVIMGVSVHSQRMEKCILKLLHFYTTNYLMVLSLWNCLIVWITSSSMLCMRSLFLGSMIVWKPFDKIGVSMLYLMKIILYHYSCLLKVLLSQNLMVKLVKTSTEYW